MMVCGRWMKSWASDLQGDEVIGSDSTGNWRAFVLSPYCLYSVSTLSTSFSSSLSLLSYCLHPLLVSPLCLYFVSSLYYLSTSSLLSTHTVHANKWGVLTLFLGGDQIHFLAKGQILQCLLGTGVLPASCDSLHLIYTRLHQTEFVVNFEFGFGQTMRQHDDFPLVPPGSSWEPKHTSVEWFHRRTSERTMSCPNMSDCDDNEDYNSALTSADMWHVS